MGCAHTIWVTLPQEGSAAKCYSTTYTRLSSPERLDDQITTDPRPCPLEAYIAGDTLPHQPIGARHVTVL